MLRTPEQLKGKTHQTKIAAFDTFHSTSSKDAHRALQYVALMMIPPRHHEDVLNLPISESRSRTVHFVILSHRT